MKRRNFLKTQHQSNYKKANRFKNPYFTKRKQFSPLINKIFFAMVTVGAIIGFSYLLLTLKLFKIQSVDATGLITIDPEQIESYTRQFLDEKRLNIFPQSHIWLTDDNELIKRLENDFDLTDVQISRSGRKLAVNATERITQAIWVSGDRLFFIDNQGTIIRELTLDEILDVQERVYSGVDSTNFIQSDVFLIFDKKRQVVNIGDQVLLPGVIENLQIINGSISELDIEPGDFLIEQRLTEWLTLNIKHGFDIYINGAGDPYRQLENLNLILDEYKNQLPKIEYIDLRFENRVYIK